MERDIITYSYTVRSRSTAVGLFGIAIASSYYPSFSGCPPSVSMHSTPRSCDRLISCSPSIGNLCRLDQQCTRRQLLRRSRFPTRSGILQCLRLPERVIDVYDLLPFVAVRTEGPGTARTRSCVFLFLRCHARRRVYASIHALRRCLFGGIGHGEFDVVGVPPRVCIFDGTWSLY